MQAVRFPAKESLAMSAQTFNVLVMGDATAARRVLLASLKASGFAAEKADNPYETLDAIRGRRFDLALPDIESLSGISSMDLCRFGRSGRPLGSC